MSSHLRIRQRHVMCRPRCAEAESHNATGDMPWHPKYRPETAALWTSVDRVPKLQARAGHLKEETKNAIIENQSYAHEHGRDRPESSSWTWPQ